MARSGPNPAGFDRPRVRVVAVEHGESRDVVSDVDLVAHLEKPPMKRMAFCGESGAQRHPEPGRAWKSCSTTSGPRSAVRLALGRRRARTGKGSSIRGSFGSLHPSSMTNRCARPSAINPSKTPPQRSIVLIDGMFLDRQTSATDSRPASRAKATTCCNAQDATPRPRAEGRTP